MNDEDTKSRLPVHIIQGAGYYAKVKTENVSKIGEPGQPVAGNLPATLVEVQGSNMEPVDQRVPAQSTRETPCTARGWKKRASCW